MKAASIFTILLFTLLTASCKKDFLEAKPSTTIGTPTTVAECQAMLENVDVVNRATPALPQMASDDYIFVDAAAWQGNNLYNAEHNGYIWAKDLYEGQKDIKDWNTGYAAIFICNNVLDALENIPVTSLNQKDWNSNKGRALFMRAYVLYDLVRSFSPAYDGQTATADLGMPVRLHAGVDKNETRATVQQTYDRILSDLAESNSLLPAEIEPNNRHRPSKVAIMALYARIYLSMRKYDQAEQYANSTLNLYSVLIDYNSINILDRLPFTMNNIETILNTTVIANYYSTVTCGGYYNTVMINPELYSLYENNDLRKGVYFGINPLTGFSYMKLGYAGAYNSPFTGLATDEIYLIKAECLVRKYEVDQAMSVLNSLLLKRYKTGTFTPLTASDPIDALNKVLLERRKELIWRSLRWSDLKRLNKEGANITLTREINGILYILRPNDPKYIFPIPDDEIAFSHIIQNSR